MLHYLEIAIFKGLELVNPLIDDVIVSKVSSNIIGKQDWHIENFDSLGSSHIKVKNFVLVTSTTNLCL